SFVNNLTKAKLDEVVESFPPDARESVMRKFKTWDPDLLKNYLSSLHVDFVAGDAKEDASTSFPIKYSLYKAVPYQQKLTKFIDDMLATEVKTDDANKLSDYVLEQMRLWGQEESSRESRDGRIDLEKIGDDYFISSESSFFTSLSESLDSALKQ
ncbi:MAG: hypothetical protein Q4P72_03990, partial [Eubacteriales bacterium]|nr:hypothetical protein [Eubacteriales bacterium]